MLRPLPKLIDKLVLYEYGFGRLNFFGLIFSSRFLRFEILSPIGEPPYLDAVDRFVWGGRAQLFAGGGAIWQRLAWGTHNFLPIGLLAFGFFFAGDRSLFFLLWLSNGIDRYCVCLGLLATANTVRAVLIFFNNWEEECWWGGLWFLAIRLVVCCGAYWVLLMLVIGAITVFPGTFS